MLGKGGEVLTTINLTKIGGIWKVASVTLNAGAHKVVPPAAGIATSIIPPPSPPPSLPSLQSATSISDEVPGPQVAGMCMARLAARTNVLLDNADCPVGLSQQVGATTRCTATKNGQTAGMTVRLDSYDPATRHFEVSCAIDSHIQ